MKIQPKQIAVFVLTVLTVDGSSVSGKIVERYAYDPYGKTIFLDGNGVPIGFSNSVDPTADQFYHDADIDAIDLADLNYCADSGSGDALCVYVHDRNGDRHIDFIDQGMFWGFEGFDSNGTAAPPEFGMPPRFRFDADGDGWLDMFDYAGLQQCMGASDILCTHIYDADVDGTVDDDDADAFIAAVTGPGIPGWEPTATESRYGNPFAWTGQRYDATTQQYHFTYRTYSIALARFVQEDMQGITSLIDAHPGGIGYAPSASAPSIAAQSEYVNGFNLFQYVGSNPVNVVDPLGLSWDDDVDNLLSDLDGHKIAYTGALAAGAKIALIGVNTTADLLGGILGLDLMTAFKNTFTGDPSFGDLLEIGLSAGGGAVIFKSFKYLRKIFKGRSARRLCNCFVEGTLVDTPDGSVPIECLAEGDSVYTVHEDSPGAEKGEGRVTRVFRNVAPAILWITLASGQVVGTTPGHEVWTHEKGWMLAGDLEVGDRFIGLEGEPVEVAGLHLDRTPTPVYNLEVNGTFTFFAEGVWVHNNSCPAILPLHRAHGGLDHTGLIQERILDLQSTSGVRGIRMNQALVSPNKGKMTNLRPNVQYIGADEKIYIEAIIDTHPPGANRETEFRRLLGDEFGG